MDANFFYTRSLQTKAKRVVIMDWSELSFRNALFKSDLSTIEHNGAPTFKAKYEKRK